MEVERQWRGGEGSIGTLLVNNNIRRWANNNNQTGREGINSHPVVKYLPLWIF